MKIRTKFNLRMMILRDEKKCLRISKLEISVLHIFSKPKFVKSEINCESVAKFINLLNPVNDVGSFEPTDARISRVCIVFTAISVS